MAGHDPLRPELRHRPRWHRRNHCPLYFDQKRLPEASAAHHRRADDHYGDSCSLCRCLRRADHLFLSCSKSICKEADIDPNSQFGRLLYLGCFTSACVGVNIMGKMNALHWATAQFFINGTGVDIPPYAFSLYSLVLLAVFIFVYILSMKFIFRCDMNKLSGVDLIQVLGTDNTKPSRKQLIPLLAFLLIAVYTFFLRLYPRGPSCHLRSERHGKHRFRLR